MNEKIYCYLSRGCVFYVLFNVAVGVSLNLSGFFTLCVITNLNSHTYYYYYRCYYYHHHHEYPFSSSNTTVPFQVRMHIIHGLPVNQLQRQSVKKVVK